MQLEYKNPAGQELVGRELMCCWPAVGWCPGTVKRANMDGRFKIDDETVNFFVFYEE